MKRKIKFIPLLLACLMIISVFAGCGGGPAKDIVGTWAVSPESSTVMTFYEDGKCEVSSTYGEESWVVDSDNTLRLTDYYGGQIGTFTYVAKDKVEEFKSQNSNSYYWYVDGNELNFNGTTYMRR